MAGVEALTPQDDHQRHSLRTLLAARAGLWRSLGEHARACRDRDFALAVPPVDRPDDAYLRAYLLVLLALQDLADDPAAALARTRTAIAIAPAPAPFRTRLADEPALAEFADDPAWQALLRLHDGPPRRRLAGPTPDVAATARDSDVVRPRPRPALPPSRGAAYPRVMACPALASTTACALALAALALLPAEARACEPDPCYGVYEWLDFVFPVNTDSIPRDGVIILSYNAVGDLSPAEVAAGLEFTLTQDGAPVAGVVEDVGVPGTVVFRPAAPLVPNVLTTATLLYNNPSDAKDAGCAFGDVEFEFDMHIAAADSVPLGPPELTGSYTVDVLEDRGLGDLACCDGAYPSSFECGGVDVYWEDGYCTPIRGTRVLSLNLLASNLLPRPTAGQLVTTYRINGADAFTGPGNTNLFTFAESEACVVVEQRNLANGDTTQSPETCFGADEQLGPVDIDPGPGLAGFCAGAPYTCEVAGDADPAQWDPEQCTPLDPPGETGDAPTSTASDGDSSGAGESGDGDPPEDSKADGCGCTTTPTAPAPLLGLAALALLRRRRRA